MTAIFNNQSVRDLAWAVSSPPLISNSSHYCAWPESEWYRQIFEETLPWLKTLDADPAELDELLASQKDRRLGKYFETLWYFWLSHHQHYDVVENNVQIIIDGETLGEIDFIVFDKTTKKTIHWELAVKFYLGAGNTREMCNWYGPNLRDRLDIKVEHLISRQSVISKDQRVVQWLTSQGIRIDQCTVILKGRLYFPWAAKQAGCLIRTMLPLQCSQELLYGWWFQRCEFDEEFDYRQQFEPLINNGWLEKIPTDTRKDLHTKMDIFKAVSTKEVRLPLHVQLCSARHSWDRAFLVEPGWPRSDS